MTTPLTIALIQFLYLIALVRPLGAACLALPQGVRVGIGYLAANALTMVIGYTLDALGCFSVARVFGIWLGICLLLNLLVLRHHPAQHRLTKGETYIYGLALIGMAVTVWVRLADPIQNAALSGTDAYQFLNYYAWLLGEQKAIHDYPSGFALATSMAPWTIQPYAAARWAVHLVFLACLPAAFGLWRQMGGMRFALAISVLLGCAWFLYPISAYHPHFIQWTTVFIGMPALLILYARLARGERALPLIILAIPVNLAFTMTAAYFALYLNVLLPLLLIATNLRAGLRQTMQRMIPAAAVALIVPITLLFYYGVLARYFFTYWASDIHAQADMVAEASNVVAASVDSAQAAATAHATIHPLARVIIAFLSPRVPVTIGPRWVVYAALIALGCWLWWHAHTRRLAAMRLLAGVMMFSSFSAMTGICELPAWQGRNVFIALYTGLAASLWSCMYCFSATVKCVLRSPLLLLAVFLCVAAPSVYAPPMIGRNVPVADVIHPRNLPADNQVLAELIRPPGRPSEKKSLAVVPNRDASSHSQLIRSLLRLHYPHPRENAFPGYRMIRTVNPRQAFEHDALLMPAPMLDAYPLPVTFEIHTIGRDYVFAIRKIDAP